MIDKKDLTIILPTLNEQEAIGPVIDELQQYGYNNILVIDGHSTDKTREIAEEKKVECHIQKGRGKADGIKDALNYVKTSHVLIMDTDYTYDPADIQRFLEKANSFDEIIGSRNLKSKEIPRLNQFGNSLITKTFNLVMGAKLSDVCSGMYLIKTDLLRGMDLQLKGYQIELELAAKTGEIGKVTQVPINYRQRLGETKMSAVKEGINVFKNLYKFAKFYNPTLLFSIFAGFLIIPGLILLAIIGIRWLIDHTLFSVGLTEIAIVLTIMGSNAIAFALISSHLRRIERKVNALNWKLENNR
jgi:dolichol-phosphate mannosyltransferase